VSARVLESPRPLVVATRARQDRRIPSLDGLRAVSIALVVLAHLSGTSGFALPGSFASILALGELGVRVFFVISGFLITKLLLEEAERTGRISLLRFYLRRTFRIFPPYYAFILVLIVLDAARWVTLWSTRSRIPPTITPADRGTLATRGRSRSRSSSICCGLPCSSFSGDGEVSGSP